ncbi:universal stress protein [Geobacter sulfurreducens subsp. ethanolicus]|uniref:universal stress protein n=1 Tax=Geobacter sulfurreducens TaxID=35554 RepID=UPI0025726098|nr:universal stress protein [Geobacter sulfurreducens]BEH09692.1 universal stress protein [Geobacter sulfurreducens subsp. ethanolicus]
MKILLAFDGSPSSDAAAMEVCRRPWPPGSEVRVITVLSPVEPNLLGGEGDQTTAFDYIISRQEGAATKRLNAVTADVAQRTPELGVTSALLEGRPKDAILNEVERWGADLIVVGAHGYGVIRRFFLGSVSLAVALHAPCSVEIVRVT